MSTLRARKKEETRAAISAAALRLFARRGYAAVTMAEVAAAAGVSERTLFRYVTDKEDLLFGEDEVMLAALAEALASRPADEPHAVALTHAGATLMLAFELRREELRTRTAVIDATPVLAARDRGKQAGFEAVLADGLIERGAHPVAARLLGRVVMACFDESVRGWLQDGDGASLPERFAANLRAVGELVR